MGAEEVARAADSGNETHGRLGPEGVLREILVGNDWITPSLEGYDMKKRGSPYRIRIGVSTGGATEIVLELEERARRETEKESFFVS